MMNLKYTFFFILWFCLPFISVSQSVKHITVDDGLPQSFVSGVVQGENDFIWIATRNGLVRFDGNNYKVFQHEPRNEKSLASNLIMHIEKTQDNTLLIRYESGEIDALNMSTENVDHYIDKAFILKHNISDNNETWLITAKKELWFFSKTNKLKRISLNRKQNDSEFDFKNDTIRALFEDNKKRFWVLSQNNISWYDEVNNSFVSEKIPYQMNYNNDAYFGYDVPYVYQINDEEIVWSDKEFLYKYSLQKKSFKRDVLPFKLKYSIKNMSVYDCDVAYFVHNQKLYSYKDSVSHIADLPMKTNNSVKTFLLDKSGLLWVALNTDGVYQIDFSHQFKNFTYEDSFLVDILQNYYEIDINSEKDIISEDKFFLPLSYYMRSYTAKNEIWIALNETVYNYNFETGERNKLPKLNSVKKNPDPIVGLTLIDNYKLTAILESGKLMCYDSLEVKWEALSEKFNAAIDENGKIKPNGLLFAENKLWIITKSNGLYFFDLENESVEKISNKEFPVSNLIDIINDPEFDHILWIASYSGLIKFNTKNLKSTIYSTKQGLPDNTIYSILTDDNGYLWLGTNAGLCRFNTKDFSQKTFTSAHGISLLEYNRHHKLVLPNGFFAFGGTKKGVRFNPLNLKTDQFNPLTSITSIEVNNQSIDTISNSNSVDELNLSYKENSLSIQYSALQFNQPQDINYRYRLIGYDKNGEWKEVDKRRQAIYTKIPPGEYSFEVNASNTSGIWSDKIKKMTIKISPPWWKTWWAIVLYILVFLFFIFIYIRYQVNQKVMANQVALKNKEAIRLKELDEVKSKFFSNITHELRTPLSLILGPAERLKAKLDKKEDKKLLNIILQNGKSLLGLTDQLLDFSKIQAGVLKPTYSKGVIGEVIWDVVDAFKEELSNRQITLSFNNSSSGVFSFSKEFLERIVYNLLSNAIKYNKENGKIFIGLRELDYGIEIKIADTGIGISDIHLKKIFNRYYRENSIESNTTGSGIGLSLVEELVNLQNGEITVKSQIENPSGTTFTIILPYKKIEENKASLKKGASCKPDLYKDIVLIVEDNIELREFIKNCLTAYYQVAVAGSGEEALQVAQETLPDVIITDVMMGGMSGIELCSKLKRNIITNHIPIILLTAKTDTESKLKGLAAGANEYLYKPFNLVELELRIKNLIDFRKQQRGFLYENLHKLPDKNKQIPQELNTFEEDPFIKEVLTIVNSELNDEQFNVERLAEKLNMSRTSLHRKVKAITNTSAGQIIKLQRLKRAIELFTEDFTVSEVAYQTGFGSPSYFSKCFKDIYGVTPSQFIEK
ncbi:response regulator [Mesonia aquimarina]|uniref:response regulator n=1 Tax=Mesonia aquimarina TaxID=1504967 RepID=UPI000EF5AFCD|nr:response regulator [Mesonia aquimarina]